MREREGELTKWVCTLSPIKSICGSEKKLTAEWSGKNNATERRDITAQDHKYTQK